MGGVWLRAVWHALSTRMQWGGQTASRRWEETVAVRGAMSDTGGFRRIGQRAAVSGRLLVVYRVRVYSAGHEWRVVECGSEQLEVVVLLWRIR